MSNIVKKETSGIIPKEIANITLEELMSTEGVEFHKKNNILRMKQRIANEIVTVEVRSYDDTNIISQSRTNKSRPVKWNRLSRNFEKREELKQKWPISWGQLKQTSLRLKKK